MVNSSRKHTHSHCPHLWMVKYKHTFTLSNTHIHVAPHLWMVKYKYTHSRCLPPMNGIVHLMNHTNIFAYNTKSNRSKHTQCKSIHDTICDISCISLSQATHTQRERVSSNSNIMEYTSSWIMKLIYQNLKFKLQECLWLNYHVFKSINHGFDHIWIAIVSKHRNMVEIESISMVKILSIKFMRRTQP